MTDSELHLTRPTSRQLAYLNDLAIKAGQSFSYPRTRAQASAEIKRLKAAKRTSASDRRRETHQLRRDFAERRGDASSVRDDELAGWGSHATWS
jgi:hypothetical protein